MTKKSNNRLHNIVFFTFTQHRTFRDVNVCNILYTLIHKEHHYLNSFVYTPLARDFFFVDIAVYTILVDFVFTNLCIHVVTFFTQFLSIHSLFFSCFK